MDEHWNRGLRAVRLRGEALDGWLVVAVVTTGIYCRPSCPGVARANDENLRFLADPAAARRQDFRACKRCDPDAAVGAGPAGWPAAP